MIRMYPPILILQMFCMYHIYNNSKDFKWYMLVFFLPLFGSLIYLYVHFATNTNIDTVADVVQNFVPDAKLKNLTSELEFSDITTNRLNLANEYLLRGDGASAIEHYEICLEKSHKPDPFVQTKLLQANYLEGKYDKVVELGQSLGNDKEFKKSEERIAYAQALKYTGQISEAESEFEKMDTKYSNYSQRLAYAEFLDSTGRTEASDQKLEEMLEEISKMDRREKRFKAVVIKEINNAYKRGFA